MAAPDGLIGTRLGNYQIREKIGQGGMGVVYKALDLSLGREVALKVLPDVDDERSKERFSREARSAARLNHSSIVTVYGVGRHGDSYFIAMEYVDGESLKDLIKREGKLSLRVALDYTLQVAQALREASRNNIVHRDIKPSNIMIDRDNRAKVMDFGLALMSEESTKLTTAGRTLGTPSFMSPEQWMDSHVDARADIYSLGVTLFKMLSGRTLFKASTPMALMRKVVDEPRPSLREIDDSIPDAVCDIVAKMIEKDPNLRYGSASELCDVLESYMNGIRNAPALPAFEKEPFSSPWPKATTPPTDQGAASAREEETTVALHPPAAVHHQADTRRSWGIGIGIGVAVLSALALFVLASGGNDFYTPLFPEDDFVWIKPGTFDMGSPVRETGHSEVETLHSVTLTEGFWMGKFEVTQQQWEDVMGYNPAIFQGADLPIHQVSWDEVADFIDTLNDMAGTRFRLPTEAEWEFACRGGSVTPHGFEPTRESLDDHAWYSANSKTMVYAPGLKIPNAWGIYDMLGNVREWCEDWVGVYPSNAGIDPTGPSTGTNKVHRGGSWGVDAAQCRAAARSAQHPSKGSSDLGFRLCL